MGKYYLFFLTIAFYFLGCSTNEVSKSDNLPSQTPAVSKKPKETLSEIDLTTIKHTVIPQGRVQDNGVSDENFKLLSITEDLIVNGKDSIPFLISKLDDETKMDNQVINFWHEVYVGDIALIILTDLFTQRDEMSTILGFEWDTFLERGNDKDSAREDILRKYIKKHGRKKIRQKWQDVWDFHKENIFWNEKERCFDVRRAPA